MIKKTSFEICFAFSVANGTGRAISLLFLIE
jgi:hypothetical protein